MSDHDTPVSGERSLNPDDARRESAGHTFAVVGVNPDTSRDAIDTCTRHGSIADATASVHERADGRLYAIVDTTSGEALDTVFSTPADGCEAAPAAEASDGQASPY